MSTDRDPMTVLAALRPVSVVERHWPGDTPPPHLPVAPRRPRRTRRILVTAALTTALIGAGTGIAGAAGVLPDSFTGSLSFWTGDTHGRVDVQDARRVAQEPGPDGTVLSVWSARGTDGTVCVAPLFEAPGPLDRPAPTGFHLAGGQCAAPAPGEPFGNLGGSADEHGVHTMWATAGHALRAELRFPDGTARPALRAAGMFFVWYVTDARTAPPVLVGLDAAGRVVGRSPLPRLVR